MANTVFLPTLYKIVNQNLNITSATINVALEKEDGVPYTSNAEHEFMSQVLAAGFTEVTVSGYARQTIATKTLAVDGPNLWVEWDHADVTFAALATGETIRAYIVYFEIGADTVDCPLFYVDTGVTGLPLATNGTDVKIIINTQGHLHFKQGS